MFNLFENTPNTKILLVVWAGLVVLSLGFILNDIANSSEVIKRDSFMRGLGYTWKADAYLKEERK